MTQTSIAVADPAKPALTGIRQAAHVAFGYGVALFAAGVVVQVFLAGSGVFGMHGTDAAHAGTFDPHRMLGNALGVAAAVLFLLALVARQSLRLVIGALVLAVLTEVAQHGLADAGGSNHWLGGLHAADGVLILLLGCWLAFAARRRTRERSA